MALVDSGASDILLDPQIGELLGIDIPTGEKIVYAAVGSEVVGYLHTLKMRVAGTRYTHEVPCAFTEIGGDVRAVLGQRGFFEHYKPTVSLDVISLVVSSCEYFRGHIEPYAAH